MRKFVTVLLILSAIGIVYFTGKELSFPYQHSSKSQANHATTPTIAKNGIENATTFQTKDNTFSFEFPKDWHLTDTTPLDGQGQFGRIVESWIIQSFEMIEPGGGGIPENSVKMDFEISEGGFNTDLELLVDCEMKTFLCERQKINGQEYMIAESTLNTGMRTKTLATIKGQKIYRVNTLIQTGDQQTNNVLTVEKIIQSFTITQ